MDGCAAPTSVSSAGDARWPRARSIRSADRAGVGISDVAAGSPAEAAGLRPTDTILALEGALIESTGDLQRLMGPDVIGRPITLRILRDNAAVDVVVVPTELS